MTTGHIVVDFHRNIDFHTAEGVDDILESVEVDFGIMVDIDSGQFRYRLDRTGGTAVGVGGIDLLLSVTG